MRKILICYPYLLHEDKDKKVTPYWLEYHEEGEKPRLGKCPRHNSHTMETWTFADPVAMQKVGGLRTYTHQVTARREKSWVQVRIDLEGGDFLITWVPPELKNLDWQSMLVISDVPQAI